MKRLAINRCPKHGWWAIIIEDEHGGMRVTPSKCCGQWDTVKAWPLSAREWRELAEQCEAAAQEQENARV